MNFKNLAENLIYIMLSVVVGGVIGYTASTHSNKQTILLLKPTIEQAIKKETTSILNKYETTIKKQKVKKGVSSIDYTPKVQNVIENKPDSLILKPKIKKRKGFFKRLFKK